MLPGLDGLQVCRALQGACRHRPGADHHPHGQGEEPDRIVGLKLGADDYITKPFSPNEVIARIRVLLRRAHRPATGDSRILYGPLTVDVDGHLVKTDGEEVKLTAKEFLLLRYPMEHRGRVLSRDLLLLGCLGLLLHWRHPHGRCPRPAPPRKAADPVRRDCTVKQFGYKLMDLLRLARD